jgi:hypothetical protein
VKPVKRKSNFVRRGQDAGCAGKNIVYDDAR